MTIERTHVTNRVILYGHRCFTHEIRTQDIGRCSRNVVDEAIPHGMERAGEPQTTEDYSCPFDFAPKQVMADDIMPSAAAPGSDDPRYHGHVLGGGAGSGHGSYDR